MTLVDLLLVLPPPFLEPVKAAGMAAALKDSKCMGCSRGHSRAGFGMTTTRTVRHDVVWKKSLGSHLSREKVP